MIEARHAWLLRNTDTAFESIDAPAGSGLYACKICVGHGRGTTRIARAQQASHLAAHRREKIGKREKAEDFLASVA